jgi:uncharacterized protein (DUF433 family)
MDYRKIITIDPRVRDGQPCIRGLPITVPITVAEVIGYLASGMTIEQVLAKHTELTREDIIACLKFAADSSEGGSAPTPHPVSPSPRGPIIVEESHDKPDA